MFLMIALHGFSQTDSAGKISVTRKAAETALKVDDSLQVMKREKAALEEKTASLTRAVQNSDSTAAYWKAADAKSQSIIQGKNSEIARHETKYTVSQAYNKELLRTISRKKWTIRIISFVSIGVTGTLTYLLLKK